MRTLIHAAFLAGLLVPGAAYAADLDYPYEPAPPPVVVAPPPVVVAPPCGVYRPCYRPYRLGFWRRPWRFGLVGPRPFVGPRPYAVGPRSYAVAPRPEGYGYDYDRERFERSREHASRYGYERPDVDGPRGGPREFGPRGGYGPRDYGQRGEPRDGYGPRGGYEARERYGAGRPYADPLGHDRYGPRGGRGPELDERG